MAENLSKKPSKSILKNSSSFDTPDAKLPSGNRARAATKGGAKWDEMNIMATLHPPDKDYGHMKIDEPKTPYNYEGLNLDVDSLDADALAEKIRQAGKEQPKALRESDESDEEDDETPEEKAAKKDFEQKRKKHYNEYYAVKLARKLLEKEEEDDEEADDADEKLKKSRLNAELNRKNTKPGVLQVTPCRPPSRDRGQPTCPDKAACAVGGVAAASGGGGASSAARKSDCAGSRHCGCMGGFRKM